MRSVLSKSIVSNVVQGFVVRALAVTALAVASTYAAGCTTSNDPQASVDAPAQGEQARGPSAAISSALDELTVRADQKNAIVLAKTELSASHAVVEGAKSKLAQELASEVRAGAVSHDKLGPFEAALDAAMKSQKPAMDKVMNELHATLDAGQRAQLIASLHEHVGKFMHHGDKKDRVGHLESIGKEIGCSDAQIASIKAKLADSGEAKAPEQHDHEAMRAQMKEFAEAFKSDTFDATKFEVGHSFAHEMSGHTDRIERVLTVALPELTPAQRTALADKILAHAQEAE